MLYFFFSFILSLLFEKKKGKKVVNTITSNST